MTDLEREAREAAEGLVPNKGYGYKAVRDVVREEGFVFGYITAAEPRERRIAELERLNKAAKLIIDDLHAEEKKNENRIAELEAKVAEATKQRDAWMEHLRRSHEGLMILHDRLDLQEMAGAAEVEKITHRSGENFRTGNGLAASCWRANGQSFGWSVDLAIEIAKLLRYSAVRMRVMEENPTNGV